MSGVSFPLLSACASTWTRSGPAGEQGVLSPFHRRMWISRQQACCGGSQSSRAGTDRQRLLHVTGSETALIFNALCPYVSLRKQSSSPSSPPDASGGDPDAGKGPGGQSADAQKPALGAVSGHSTVLTWNAGRR